jgi:hypothetical protein
MFNLVIPSETKLIIHEFNNETPVVSNNNNITVCLNMIVRNESNIITRLLNSVLPIFKIEYIANANITTLRIQTETNNAAIV